MAHSNGKRFRFFLTGGVLLTALVVSVSIFAAKHRRDWYRESEQIALPPEMLPIQEKQLVLRQHGSGWQVCRVKRFVWQEQVLVLRKGSEVFDVVRAFEVADSNPLSHFAWLCVILEVTPRLFAAVDQVKVDEQLLKELEASDDVLIKAADVKPPEFLLLK